MEATAGTGVTTILEHDVEESGCLMLTGRSGEALPDTAEEGFEPNDDRLTSDPDWQEDDGAIYNGYIEDEGTIYDETEAYASSYGWDEYDEAIEYEEKDEAFDTFDEENGATQHPMAGFSDNSSYEADGYGEHEQAAGLGLLDWEDVDSDPPPQLSYVYYEGMYILDIPAEILNALLRHLINVFEASFHRFGHCHFGEDLKSDEWRQKILTDEGIGRLANLPWDKVHAVEVKDWVTFLERVYYAGKLPKDALANPERFSPPDPTPALAILGMARYVRNRTFHHDESVIECQLRLSLKIPRVLKDQKMADELEAIYEVVNNDAELETPSSKWVRDILFPSQPEFGTCLEVETKILSILEEGSFYFAQREDCQLLEERYWTNPYNGEMQLYACKWENTSPSKYWDLAEALKPEECANLDGQFFLHEHLRKAVMKSATALRNWVAHRAILDDWEVCYAGKNTMLCLILMDDRIRAIEVESLVEAFLRKIPRTDALLRLYKASWNDEPARRLAIAEVCRRNGIEPDPSDYPIRETSTVSPFARSETGSRWLEISKSAKAKYSLNCDEEWDLWDSAIQRFVFCDSMHNILKREPPME